MEKRRQVSKACANCRISHVSCSVERPCRRCIQTGREASCEDRPRKRREMRQKNAQSDDVSLGDPHALALDRTMVLRSLSAGSGILLQSMSDSEVALMSASPSRQMRGMSVDSTAPMAFGLNPSAPYYNYMMPHGIPEPSSPEMMSIRSVSSPTVTYMGNQQGQPMYGNPQQDMSVYYGSLPYSTYGNMMRPTPSVGPTTPPSPPQTAWVGANRQDPHGWYPQQPAMRIPMEDSSGSLKTYATTAVNSSGSSPIMGAAPGVGNAQSIMGASPMSRPEGSIPGYVVFRATDYVIVDFNRLFVECMQLPVEPSMSYLDCLHHSETNLMMDVVVDLSTNAGKVRVERQLLRSGAESFVTYIGNPVNNYGLEYITACIYVTSRSPRGSMP